MPGFPLLYSIFKNHKGCAGELAQWVKSFLCKCGDLSSNPRTPTSQLHRTNVCNYVLLLGGEAEAGGFLNTPRPLSLEYLCDNKSDPVPKKANSED